MSELLSSTPFWMGLSIACYALGARIQQKTGSPLCNPLLIASILVGAVLVGTDTAYQTYQNAGEMISFFLTPATVALALSIFRKLEVLHANLLPILAGALVGSAVSIVSVIGFSRLFGLSDVTMRSLVPKSVTTPIGRPVRGDRHHSRIYRHCGRSAAARLPESAWRQGSGADGTFDRHGLACSRYFARDPAGRNRGSNEWSCHRRGRIADRADCVGGVGSFGMTVERAAERRSFLLPDRRQAARFFQKIRQIP